MLGTLKRAAPTFVLVLLGGCYNGRIIPIATHLEPPSFNIAKGEAWRHADSLWNLRAEPRQARQALRAYEKALAKQPNAPELQIRYARACHFIGTYVEPNPARSIGFYQRGANAAEDALQSHPGFRRVM